MSVAIQKVDGVDSVKVSLNQGRADVRFKPGNRVTVERILEVIRDNGFTPRGSEVRIAGKVIERGGRPALSVTCLDLVYLLVDHPDARGKVGELQKVVVGKQVTVSGYLSEVTKDVKPEEPRRLEVRDFAVESK